jgi:hypothetical protein
MNQAGTTPPPIFLEAGWQPIETAPKDGKVIILLGVNFPPKVALGYWDSEGDSWVDRHGKLTGECHHLTKAGFWASEGGWFQPDEVSHWMHLPELPVFV